MAEARCICPKGWAAEPMASCPVHAGAVRVVQEISTIRREVANPIPFTLTPSMVAMVRAWHEKFGQQVRDRPDATATDAEVTYRHQLHIEEVYELCEAMKRRDIVAIADAIADELYVLLGTALSYGIPIDEVFAEVHRSNMTKTFDPSRAKYAGKVVVKGPSYSPPVLGPLLGSGVEHA